MQLKRTIHHQMKMKLLVFLLLDLEWLSVQLVDDLDGEQLAVTPEESIVLEALIRIRMILLYMYIYM